MPMANDYAAEMNPSVARAVALLRAINVGGHTVKMNALRTIVAGLGLANVETFIASGNVIFTVAGEDLAALESTIETALQQALGYTVTTFIRSLDELAAIVQYQPFPESDNELVGSSLQVGFLKVVPDTLTQQKLLALASTIDAFNIHGRELYWRRLPPVSSSTISGALLEKTLAMPTTLRNITTIRRLVAKYGSLA